MTEAKRLAFKRSELRRGQEMMGEMAGMNFNPKVTEGEIGWLAERLAGAITYTLSSPNEVDSNLEPGNVVDGLYRIARALHHVATAIEQLNGPKDEP